MSESVDFLIVGGGISGLCLHHELLKRGCSSLLINKDEVNVSTSIAAGIVNPIAGKFFTLSWRANDFFGTLEDFYKKLEVLTGRSFYYPKEIRRVLSTAGEQNIWLSKSHMDKYKGYCDYLPSENSFGQIKILQGGHLDTGIFLLAMRTYFNKNGSYINAQFDFEQLKPDEQRYKNISYKNIVFCEGFDLKNNPYFKYLPFSPNKGELLEIESQELNEDVILTGSVFVLPVGNKRFKIGATYEHHVLDLEPTDKNRSYLLERLEKITNADYKVVNHFVGLRPAVKDRRPLLGAHPNQDSMFVFNGLGSKGVSMAPTLSVELANFMLLKGELHKECNIARFS